MQKTNVMRVLDKNKIIYNTYEYDISDDKIDGVSVAKKLNQDPNKVFKTLVTQGVTKALYVFVIPVNSELDLKAAAKACGEKKVDMIHVKDINKYTGYIRGGCSPIGMKKLYKTFIHESAKNIDLICVSGGKKGLQIELDPLSLANIVNAEFCNIIYDK